MKGRHLNDSFQKAMGRPQRCGINVHELHTVRHRPIRQISQVALEKVASGLAISGIMSKHEENSQILHA